MTSKAEVLFEPYHNGAGIEWLEETFIPQSMIFYAEMMRVVYQCALFLRTDQPVRIADIGAAHASGSNLIRRVLNNLTGVKASVTAYELQKRFAPYANAKFPEIQFKTCDFFDDSEQYDMVFCSHTLEHIKDPVGFVSRILERARCAVFYVPYRERSLIPGHVTSFDDDLLRTMPGFVWSSVSRSIGWRTEDDARVVAFVCVRPNSLDVVKLVAALHAEAAVETFPPIVVETPPPPPPPPPPTFRERLALAYEAFTSASPARRPNGI